MVLLTWLLSVSRGDTWLFLPDLVEVCAEGCFCLVFDTAGSAGVMLGPTLVVGHGISLFRYFVALCSRFASIKVDVTSGDPYVHLKDFVYESAPHKYDCHLMAYLFRKSLDGAALEWFYSFPPEEAEYFQIVQERFLQQFQDRVGPEYSFVDLVAEKMKPDEEFAVYADRWRALASKVCCPMPEEEKAKLIIANATPTYRAILDMNDITSMRSHQTVSPSLAAVKKGMLLDAKGWNIMLKIGYQPGQGLGAHLQRRTQVIPNSMQSTKCGLGYIEWAAYSSTLTSDQEPLFWTLYAHFVKGPIQQGYNTVNTKASTSAYQDLEAQWPGTKKKAEEAKAEVESDIEDLVSALNLLFQEGDITELRAVAELA
ncbi:hypothetical protein Taro_031058 [Colocasia esculenta]|uniref:G-patch domain-containing protein n=1 Tax=Colocasia esculenta TaxID=4460 RepID=A0A843VZR4_COLES|nr:hypothetical protein [Colocasia esculenta]